MKYIEELNEEDIFHLKELESDGDAIRQMMLTDGWKVLEAHLRSQLDAYIQSNAASAPDWDKYLSNAGVIKALRLLLLDAQEFLENGINASEELRTSLKS